MTSKWQEVPLRELVGYISKGIAPSYAEKESGTTIRVLNQKCNRNFQISYSESRLHDTGKKRVPAERYVREYDILINSTGAGTAGRIAQIGSVPQATTVDGHMIILRANEKILQKYLGYALKAHQWEVLQLDEGSTGQTELNRERLLDEITIRYPESFSVQEEIVLLLESIDIKMLTNTQINDNLLQQAQALYKDRFVDLKPFDGEMPLDWHIGTVSEIIELHDSKRIPLSSRERANLAKIYPYYGATSVMDYVDRYLFDGIYLLLGEDGTVVDSKGFPILQYVEGKFWVNNHAHIITGKNGFTVETLYLLFSLTNVQSIVTGAVQPKISQANLNKVSVVIPSEAELSAFNSIVQPIFAQIRNLRAENDRLAATRDTLLPRLMSGELDVSSLDI